MNYFNRLRLYIWKDYSRPYKIVRIVIFALVMAHLVGVLACQAFSVPYPGELTLLATALAAISIGCDVENMFRTWRETKRLRKERQEMSRASLAEYDAYVKAIMLAETKDKP